MTDTRPTLSLCMIVKNEESQIQGCLREAFAYCSEMIVLDTGSTDRTMDIAKAEGANVHQFEWCDDFSVARNKALEHVRGDWILVLDADERISPEHWQLLLKTIKASRHTAYDLCQLNYTNQMNVVSFVANDKRYADFAKYPGYTTSWLTRLFRRDANFQFSGRVHEHLYAQNILVQGDHLPVDIHHHGLALSESQMQKKRDLYFNLGLTKADEHPNDFKSQHEAGVACWDKQNFPKALQYFKRAHDLNARNDINLLALGTVQQILKQYDAAEKTFQSLCEFYPKHHSAHAGLGRLYFEMKRYKESVDQYIQQIRINPDHAQTRQWLQQSYSELKKTQAYMPTITVCLIVKNEEDCLDRVLGNVKPHVNEIVVLDTGSTDRTVEIAKSHGALVKQYTWNDDFASARNESMKYATSEWILVLDADEILANDDWVNLKQVIGTTSHEMFFLIQTTYTNKSILFNWKINDLAIPESQGYTGYFESPLTRLFRNTPLIRFHGAVHENAWHDQPAIRPQNTNIRIHHYGKSRNEVRMQEKSDLYFRIGKKKLVEMPTNSHAIYEMAVQLWEMGDKTDAEQYFIKALEVDPGHENARVLYGCFLHQQYRFVESLEMFIDAIRRNPKNSEAHFYVSSVLIDLKKYDFAMEMIDKAQSLGFSNHVSLLMNLGVIQANRGDLVKAEETYRRALEINPECELVLTNIVFLYRQQKKNKEALALIEKVLASNSKSFFANKIKGEILFESGERIQARDSFLKAHALEPMEDTVIAQIIIVSLAIDDETTRHQFEQKLLALASSPNKRNIMEMLSRIYVKSDKQSDLKRLSGYFFEEHSSNSRSPS